MTASFQWECACQNYGQYQPTNSLRTICYTVGTEGQPILAVCVLRQALSPCVLQRMKLSPPLR